MKWRVHEFVLTNAVELERRPAWSEQPFIEQLNVDRCQLLYELKLVEQTFCFKPSFGYCGIDVEYIKMQLNCL